MIRAALSFTGGKDCMLALYRAKEQYDVVVLVTFCPSDTSVPFRSHSLQVMERQAEAMQLEHLVCTVKEEQGSSFLESYRKHINWIHEKHGVEALITGDVQLVCSDFMERAVQGTKVRLVRPLWEQPRTELLDETLDNLEAVVTCVDTRRLNISSAEAEAVVGRPLTREWLLKDIGGKPNGGEFGEYHTMVTDAPQLFLHGRVDISQGNCVQDNGITYWHASSPTLVQK